jgi:hypothetical protein
MRACDANLAAALSGQFEARESTGAREHAECRVVDLMKASLAGDVVQVDQITKKANAEQPGQLLWALGLVKALSVLGE